jgi:hypothetical protein
MRQLVVLCEDFLLFLTRLRKRVCLAPACGFEDNRRFRIAGGRYGQR